MNLSLSKKIFQKIKSKLFGIFVVCVLLFKITVFLLGIYINFQLPDNQKLNNYPFLKGNSLAEMLIITVLIALIFEEFVYRYWIRVKKFNYRHYTSFIIFVLIAIRKRFVL